jgi:hypothetical protein
VDFQGLTEFGHLCETPPSTGTLSPISLEESMTWHSAARAQGSGSYRPKVTATAVIQTVQLVPPTPTNKKRVVSIEGSGGSGGAGILDLIGAFVMSNVTPSEGGTIDVNFYVKNSAGERFHVQEADASDAEEKISSPLTLQEGESIEVDFNETAATDGGDIEFFAQWADVQGPVKLNRINLTTTYQDIVPAPFEGRVNLPIANMSQSQGGQINYTLAKVGAVDAMADVRRLDANGAVVGEALAATDIKVGTCGTTTLTSSAPWVQIALKKGERLQARLSASVAGTHILVLPYLDIEDTDY